MLKMMNPSVIFGISAYIASGILRIQKLTQ
jgi:hypothetical protein